ncbi:nucleotidyl transferase AbiEii/AbiGii toxin family protein [Pedobacter sp.]|uniref:nucleotidyl transferase AbiEii/AbiGii toxin family protein n=1 Tax=Pedobacter sp. TaxID=1411316 RepID=UPI003BACDD3A
MAAVSAELLETIIELQSLTSLKEAYLGGGTNLAIRYNHRESVDIDLFFSGIIGRGGYKAIEEEVQEHFGERISNLHYPCDRDDQYIFLRFWIKTGKLTIKVEILQNTNFLDTVEEVNGARLATVRDIGLLKLMTAANRASFKDIYDLDYLTQEIALETLLDDLKVKQETYNKEEHKTIFDQDDEKSPVNDPLLLLKFEEHAIAKKDRPAHSDPRIIVETGSKNLMSAKSSYRRKVRVLCKKLGIAFPEIQPLN